MLILEYRFLVVLSIVYSRHRRFKAWSVLGMVFLVRVVLGMVILGTVGVPNFQTVLL
jgi:hypothetical protein